MNTKKTFDHIRDSGNYKIAIQALSTAIDLKFMDAFKASTVLSTMFVIPKEATLEDIIKFRTKGE